MSTPTSTVRIPMRTYSKLRGLARATGKPMSAILDEALDGYAADRFFAQLDEAYRVLHAQSDAWAHERAERALFEQALADGLADR